MTALDELYADKISRQVEFVSEHNGGRSPLQQANL